MWTVPQSFDKISIKYSKVKMFVLVFCCLLSFKTEIIKWHLYFRARNKLNKRVKNLFFVILFGILFVAAHNKYLFIIYLFEKQPVCIIEHPNILVLKCK